MTIKKMQDVLNQNGFKHVKVIDKDHVEIPVTDDIFFGDEAEPRIISRDDEYGGHPMSGLSNYAGILGDHRMISSIYEDMQEVFSLLK